MSIATWLRYKAKAGLPDPNIETTAVAQKECASVNASVSLVVIPRGNKRGTYKVYSSQERATIGKYAAEHGNSSAVRRYEVNECTVGLLHLLVYVSH